MIVVSDTSPLNYLILIEQVGILPILFNRVVAPPAVVAELRHRDSSRIVAAWACSLPNWLEVIAPSRVDANPRLDAGELEAIALARELHADTILIDERKATGVARQLGLTITGTLGVLTAAAERNLLDLPSSIAALRKTTFRATADMLERILQADESRRKKGRG